MKKLILTAALASAFVFANAQDMMSKKNTPILPEAGDCSLGFDAVPFLNYFGNLFNNTTDNTAYAAYQENYMIVGKYMKDENTAYRLKLRIHFGSDTHNNLIDDDTYTGTGDAPKVTDTWKASSMNFNVGAGIQKYRGKGRLKGYYGAEAALGIGSGKHTYTFANAITSSNTAPTSTDWTSPNGFGGWNASPATYGRTTEEKDGSRFNFGLRAFFGVEYFFAPKMSLSAEYGWGLGLSSVGEGENTSEIWDGVNSTVKTTTTKVGKSSSFNLDVDNAGGAIVLSAYF